MKAKDIQAYLQDYINEHPEKELFEVSVSVSPKNEIKVYVDSMQDVDIDTCVNISRYLESRLDRDKEDFELTVSSAGLDQPLKLPAQYKKNIGQEIKTTLRDGKTFKGTLVEADDKKFKIQILPKKARKKEPLIKLEMDVEANYEEVKETKIVISFK